MSSRYSSCFSLISPNMPLPQHLREADDRVQRRTQLVRHVGEELALVPAGRLQLSVESLQLLVHEVDVRRQRAELVSIRHIEPAGEVTRRDLGEPRLRALDRTDQRPREDQSQTERQRDAHGTHADDQVTRGRVRAAVGCDQRSGLFRRSVRELVREREQVGVGVDRRLEERLSIVRRRCPPCRASSACSSLRRHGGSRAGSPGALVRRPAAGRTCREPRSCRGRAATANRESPRRGESSDALPRVGSSRRSARPRRDLPRPEPRAPAAARSPVSAASRRRTIEAEASPAAAPARWTGRGRATRAPRRAPGARR